MLIFSATKRFNKALAPKLLSWSLRLHESLSSSSTFSFLSPNSVSFLPLAQRLVSIEVQDDYQQLINGKGSGKENSMSSAWENFVENTWNLFFEDRHKKLKAKRDDQKVEAEVERLLEAKRRKRQQRQRQRTATKETIQMQSDVDEMHRLSEQRVDLLEKYIRPALLPSVADFDRHLFTHHFQQNYVDGKQPTDSYDNFTKWIRGEYLIAKYGLAVQKAVKEHPELRDDAAGLSTFEADIEEAPLILPSVNTVRESFDMNDWSRQKVPLSSWEDNDDFIGGSDNDNDASNNIDELPIQHIIHHLLEGKIANSGPLNAYFEMRRREDSYELWTREYIFGLAQYLLDRIAVMDQRHKQPAEGMAETIILDVGAGDGRLAYFLRRAMKEIHLRQIKSSKKQAFQPSKLPTIIATDDGSWNPPSYDNQHIQVEQLSAVASLDKYGPTVREDGGTTNTRLIVLCSWMPSGVDWTAEFRRPLVKMEGADESVERLTEEYILIGEADDGTCGHNWHTWGNPDFYPDYNDHAQTKEIAPPYSLDGYKRVDLDELTLFQFSRFDCKRSSESKTVSFRRCG